MYSIQVLGGLYITVSQASYHMCWASKFKFDIINMDVPVQMVMYDFCIHRGIWHVLCDPVVYYQYVIDSAEAYKA